MVWQSVWSRIDSCMDLKKRWFLEARPAIRRRPDFFGQTAPKLPSRQTNRRKAVKNEVSNNAGTDTSGDAPASRPKAPSQRFST